MGQNAPPDESVPAGGVRLRAGRPATGRSATRHQRHSAIPGGEATAPSAGRSESSGESQRVAFASLRHSGSRPRGHPTRVVATARRSHPPRCCVRGRRSSMRFLGRPLVPVGRSSGRSMRPTDAARATSPLCVAERVAGPVVNGASDWQERGEQRQQDRDGEGGRQVPEREAGGNDDVGDLLDEPDEEAVEEVAERDPDQPARQGEGEGLGREDAADVAARGRRSSGGCRSRGCARARSS